MTDTGKKKDTKKGTEKAAEKDVIVIHEIASEVEAHLRDKYATRIAEGRLKRATLDMDENGKERLEVALLVPSRTTQDEFMKYVDKDPGKAKKILVRNCLVTNIDQVNNNDYLFETCVNAIAELFTIGAHEVKNF